MIILVRYIPPSWKPYVLQFQWTPPDVPPWGGLSPLMNIFEEVSSDHYQMLLPERPQG